MTRPAPTVPTTTGATSGSAAAATHLGPADLGPADLGPAGTGRGPGEDDLVRAHLPLVHHIAAEMSGRLPRHVPRDDLLSAGFAALAFAARGYDPTRGVPFGRFAATRIRGAILDELRGVDWASRSVRAQARRRERAADELAGRLGRPATRAELAAHLGVTVAELEAHEDDVHRAVVLSFSALTAAGDVDHLVPQRQPTPDAVLVERERHNYLLDAVEVLPERLRTVVVGHFFEDRSMQELAEELGVTSSRVSQLNAEALALLRDGLTAQLSPEELAPEARPGGRVARRKEAYYAAVAARSDFRARLSLPRRQPGPADRGVA